MTYSFNEWNKFMNKPLYNHRINNCTVYNIENSKKVMNDYYEIQHDELNKIMNRPRIPYEDLVCIPPTESKIRSYKLNTGDIITIAEKQIFDVFHNFYNVFRPIKREKHIVWYKPSTWFRWYRVLEVVNG